MNDSDLFQIVIAVEDDTDPWDDEIEIELPPFEKGTMYVCMEPYKQYTLEDLKIKK
jgi:hypothetical protein